MKTVINRLLVSSLVEAVARWLLGAVFVYASIHKIFEPGQFAVIIQGYALFPAVLIHPMAVVLPYLEFVGGAALILGVYPRGAGLIITFLLFLFISAISINLARGHTFDCGCFSVSHNAEVSALHLLIRDIAYFFLGVHVLWFQGRRRWCLRAD